MPKEGVKHVRTCPFCYCIALVLLLCFWFFGGLEDPQKPKNKRVKYFFFCFSKKWLFFDNLYYPYLEFTIFRILKKKLPSFGQIFGQIFGLNLRLMFQKSTLLFKCYSWPYWEFSQNRYVCRCIFFVLVLCTVLKWKVHPGGSYRSRGSMFFVGAFGG